MGSKLYTIGQVLNKTESQIFFVAISAGANLMGFFFLVASIQTRMHDCFSFMFSDKLLANSLVSQGGKYMN